MDDVKYLRAKLDEVADTLEALWEKIKRLDSKTLAERIIGICQEYIDKD